MASGICESLRQTCCVPLSNYKREIAVQMVAFVALALLLILSDWSPQIKVHIACYAVAGVAGLSILAFLWRACFPAPVAMPPMPIRRSLPGAFPVSATPAPALAPRSSVVSPFGTPPRTSLPAFPPASPVDSLPAVLGRAGGGFGSEAPSPGSEPYDPKNYYTLQNVIEMVASKVDLTHSELSVQSFIAAPPRDGLIFKCAEGYLLRIQSAAAAKDSWLHLVANSTLTTVKVTVLGLPGNTPFRDFSLQRSTITENPTFQLLQQCLVGR